LGSLPVPWVDALFVSRPACAGIGSPAGRAGQQSPGCCLRRSPLFRRLVPRRREALPSPRFTLGPTCPALRPRWCPARLPWREQACCLPVPRYRRLWVRLPRLVLLSTIIHFSGFNNAACVLALPLLRTRPLFDRRTSVRLPARWLAFGRVGLELPLTHWVTLTCFKRCLLYSHIPSLARREQPAGSASCDCVHATDDGECCNAKAKAAWLCSRKKGHEGEHVACTTRKHGLHRWPNASAHRWRPAADPRIAGRHARAAIR
jgi:hypothetical protein